MEKRRIFLLSLVIGLTPGALRAATYVVDQRHPEASDEADAPGSAEKPWKTISRAAEAVKPGDVVLIRSGVYRERVTIRRSGTTSGTIRAMLRSSRRCTTISSTG